MFRHNVSYVDFNGNERSEDLYFHLSLPEVTRIEAKIGKPLDQYTKELAEGQDMKKLLEFLEDIILQSYGIKTTDGRTFHKSKELRDEFENSQAYAEVFEQLITDTKLAEQFGKKVADTGKPRKNQVSPEVVNE